MNVKPQSSIKTEPKGRDKAEIHRMLKQKIKDKEARAEAEALAKEKAAAQAQAAVKIDISQGAKAASENLGEEKVMRVDPALSAIGLNDPNNPATHEKLKSAINSGMINFSPKERKVLANILE